jgi:hypothetical protein
MKKATLFPIAGIFLMLIFLFSSCLQDKDLPEPAFPTSSGEIALSQSALQFTAVENGVNPAQQTVSVSSTSGSLSGLSFSINYSGAASGWLSAQLSAMETPAQLTVSADIESLAPGSYSATLTLSATQPASTKDLSVELNVEAEPCANKFLGQWVLVEDCKFENGSFVDCQTDAPLHDEIEFLENGNGTIKTLISGTTYGNRIMSYSLDANCETLTIETSYDGTLTSYTYFPQIFPDDNPTGINLYYSDPITTDTRVKKYMRP